MQKRSRHMRTLATSTLTTSIISVFDLHSNQRFHRRRTFPTLTLSSRARHPARRPRTIASIIWSRISSRASLTSHHGLSHRYRTVSLQLSIIKFRILIIILLHEEVDWTLL